MPKQPLAYFGGTPTLPSGFIHAWPAPSSKELAAVRSVIESGRLHRVNHPSTLLFERRLQEYSSLQYVRALASGTSALHIIADFIATKDLSTHVIAASLNWPGAVAPLLAAGLRIKFVDVSLEDACLNDACIWPTYAPSDHVLLTHLFGNCAGFDQVARMVVSNNSGFTVDDAAQAIHVIASPANRPGRDGVPYLAALSGNGSKHLGAGELGAICSSSSDLIEHVDSVSLSSSSRDGGRVFSPYTLGFNFRPNPFSAAIAADRLPTMASQILSRRANVQRLHSRLSNLVGLAPLFTTDFESSFNSAPYRLDPQVFDWAPITSIRDKIVALLRAEGVPAEVWLKKPVWEYLRGIPKPSLEAFPNTKALLSSMFCIREIAPPNDFAHMDAYAQGAEKIWDRFAELPRLLELVSQDA